jgi:integrase
VRPRGNIEQLASGSLRVYAGVDVLTGRDLYLKQTIKAGPDAMVLAQRNLQEFNRLVQEGRQSKTNASLRLLVERHLEVADIERRGKESLTCYLRKHIAPLLGEHPIGSINAQLLDSFYAELRRCRDHCEGRPRVDHHQAAGDHRL